MFKSAGDSTSCRTAFRNGNQVKNLGLKIESDSGISSIPGIKGNPGLFEPFSVFLRNFVIIFSWERDKMKTNIAINISPLFPYLAKFCFSSYGPICCWPIKLKDSSKCNIWRKKRKMKFIFDIRISIEVLYKLIVSF